MIRARICSSNENLFTQSAEAEILRDINTLLESLDIEKDKRTQLAQSLIPTQIPDNGRLFSPVRFFTLEKIILDFFNCRFLRNETISFRCWKLERTESR